MKKVIVSVLFLTTVSAYAQSFRLYEVVEDHEGNLEEGDEIVNGCTLTDTCEAFDLQVYGEIGAIVENTSDEAKMVVCKREIIRLIEGAEASFCWNSCWGFETSIDTMLIEANTKTDPFRFSTHYAAPLIVGSSIVRYIFYDSENRMDSVSVVFEYITIPGTSVPSHVVNSSLSVYPNPAVDYLIVEMNDLQWQQTTVALYDAIGRKLKTQLLTSPSQKIDVNNLERGIYYLQIVENNRTVGVRKFVKE